MNNAVRAQLHFLSEEQLKAFSPGAGILLDQELQVLREKFFAKLAAIFLFHPGESVLIVRKKIVAGKYNMGILKTHLYMGIISHQVKELFSESGEACIPTSRFVDSPDYLPIIDHLKHKDGSISEETLGGNIIGQFFQEVRTCYGLNFFVGTEEVGRWFYKMEGYYPYVRPTFSRALDYPLPIGEKPPLQLVARRG